MKDEMRLASRPVVQNGGFTMSEMLIVITILGLLAAILFPVFSLARETARRASCTSNLKQLGLAFAQYTSDSEGLMAPKVSGSGTAARVWPTLILPYIKNKQIFLCPSESTNTKWSPPDGHFVDVAQGAMRPRYCGFCKGDGSGASILDDMDAPIAYSRNLIISSTWVSPGFRGSKSGFVAPSATSTVSGPVLHETTVEDPSGTIHLVDAITGSNIAATTSCGGNNSAMMSIDGDVNTDLFSDAQTSKPAYRHQEGFNALYGDGHVKWRKWGSTKPGEWSIQAGD